MSSRDFIKVENVTAHRRPSIDGILMPLGRKWEEKEILHEFFIMKFNSEASGSPCSAIGSFYGASRSHSDKISLTFSTIVRTK